MIADGMRLDEEYRVMETISSAWNEGYLTTLLLLCEFQAYFQDRIWKDLKRTSKSKQKLGYVYEVGQKTSGLTRIFPETDRDLAPGKRSQQIYISTLTYK